MNGAPHIGHANTSVAADALARWKRLDGYDVLFLTGTDEHGQKVEKAAEDAGLDPQAFTDQVAAQFEAMGPLMGLSNDQFIRTTETRHHRACQALWTRLQEAGQIYLGEYAGWYAVRDEAFYAEDELITRTDGIRVSAATGAPVEWVTEPSYFFRLSAWQDRLLALYERVPETIMPSARRNEILSFVRGGLTDLSVSRTSFRWGVPVPGDPAHVMYVWLDALTNYLTALGYPDEGADLWRFWPANLHLVGKDIIRFHTVYWPAFLMAAGLEPPCAVFSTGWWTVRGEKMSKSLGNVIPPSELVAKYGLDPVRYFLLREVPFGNDGDFSDAALIRRMNSELANDLGNLAQRTLSQIAKNLGGVLPAATAPTEDDATLLDAAAALPSVMRPLMDRVALGEAIEETWKVIRSANAYIDRQAPWALKKTDPARMAAVLRVLVDVIRPVATVLQPVMPGSMGRMLDQVGVPPDARDLARWERSCQAESCCQHPPEYSHVTSKRRPSLLMLIDSHCHLDMFPEEERAALLARAAEAGVGEMVSIGTRLGQSRNLVDLVARFPNVWCTIGVHPHNAGEGPAPEPEALAAMARPAKVVGIGESGLDYFYDKAPRAAQQASFRAHIRGARLADMPLVIHARNADDDVARMLQEEWDAGGPFKFLLHCFSSGRALAEAALTLGGSLSFSGILTFPKSEDIRAIARDAPDDRLLVETDAPYLAPVPYRGRRNEPAYVADTARVLAELRGLSQENLAALTTRNFRRLFSKTA